MSAAMNRVKQAITLTLPGLVLFVALFPRGNVGMVQAADVLVGQAVPADQRVPMDQVAHDNWQMLLQKYVDERGLVDYASWKATPADLTRLEQYLATLATARIQNNTRRDVQLAYWINAYNAVTIK